MVKVTIRTLQNKKYEIELDDSASVADLKQKIHTDHNLGAPEALKLIFKGKILKDDQNVKEANISTGFIVVMVSKTAPSKPTPSPAAAQPAQPSSPAQPAQPEPTTSATSSTSSQPAQPASPAQPAQPSSPAAAAQPSTGGTASDLVMGSQREEAIMNLMAMGYERDMVVRALQAAYNNPDRAAEYLLSGNIPAGDAPAAPPQPPASGGDDVAQAQGGGNGEGGMPEPAPAGGAGGAPAGVNPMAALAALQANPQLMQAVVTQIAQQNPELLQLVGGNPENLAKMLQDPQVMQMLLGGMAGAMGGGAGGAGGGEGGGMPGVPPGATVIQVTEEEKAAIDRLTALGFPRQKVIEAYLACDKNEEMAANYLFEHQDED